MIIASEKRWKAGVEMLYKHFLTLAARIVLPPWCSSRLVLIEEIEMQQ
jgi:hypothetical protein